MREIHDDMGYQLMLDGNAAAGLLREVFAAEMTVSPARCANCGRVHTLGQLLAFGRPMGTVLRCPTCEEVMIRIVERPGDVWVDVRGVRYLKMERAA